MDFNRQQLEAFAVVVELRNFSRAVRVLNITRGAVSWRTIALKEKLGTPLLVCGGGIWTPAAEALLRHIKVLQLLETDI